ncbi:MAG: cysteine--tRNA ligase [Pseudomonadota bacterium]
MDMLLPDLKLYNTLTRQKEVFTPLDAQNVRMYVCGPTVYDLAHIGNARPIIVFDVLFRLLRHLYGEKHVNYVRNITDVDDKINARAAEHGISIRELTDGTLKQFNEDVAALNCLVPTHQPRATDYIDEMKNMIERLVMSEHAYIADEHVLFSVNSMPNYGKLSNRSLDEMKAGARVDVEAYKRDPMDFVLWKPSTASSSKAVGNNKTEPGWPSPCKIKTPGRPGWHIECSAMSAALLGEEFDIHGGGLDLIFPHHENEIAQTCCTFGTSRMAQVWMHNGFLQMEGEKMSKSLGNFATIRDVLNDWPADVIRLTMLKTHYRQPIDWTVKALDESQKTIDVWQARSDDSVAVLSDHFLVALADDMNTPLAISALHKLDGGALKSCAQLIGLLRQSQAEWKHTRQSNTNVDENAIRKLIDDRLAARAAKNFSESDRIRDTLAEMGIRIKDNKDGTTHWEVM